VNVKSISVILASAVLLSIATYVSTKIHTLKKDNARLVSEIARANELVGAMRAEASLNVELCTSTAAQNDATATELAESLEQCNHRLAACQTPPEIRIDTDIKEMLSADCDTPIDWMQ